MVGEKCHTVCHHGKTDCYRDALKTSVRSLADSDSWKTLALAQTAQHGTVQHGTVQCSEIDKDGETQMKLRINSRTGSFESPTVLR